MTGPHVDQQGRDALDDFGVLDDDNTEDLRRTAPVTQALARLAGTAHTHKPITESG